MRAVLTLMHGCFLGGFIGTLISLIEDTGGLNVLEYVTLNSDTFVKQYIPSLSLIFILGAILSGYHVVCYLYSRRKVPTGDCPLS